MLFELILTCLSFVIFLGYNIAAIKQFGIPKSLSDTFYYYQQKNRKLAVLFPLMMFVIVCLLCPPMYEMTLVISSWSKYLCFLPWLLGLCLLFVGGCPGFSDGILAERKIHMIFAKSAAGVALAWDMIVCWKIMWITPLALLIIAAFAHGTKTAKSNSDYWWEMVAFLATFATAIVQACLLL